MLLLQEKKMLIKNFKDYKNLKKLIISFIKEK